MADTPNILDRAPTTLIRLTKRITFTGAAGAGAIGQVALATPSAPVYVHRIMPHCITLPVGVAATVSLGTAASIAALIAATIAANIAAGNYWLSAAPAANLLALPVALSGFALATPLTLDVLVANITAGVIDFEIDYEAITPGAVLT